MDTPPNLPPLYSIVEKLPENPLAQPNPHTDWAHQQQRQRREEEIRRQAELDAENRRRIEQTNQRI